MVNCTEALCEVCGDPVDPQDGHWLHDPDCPNKGVEELAHTCGCSALAHPECCPECGS